MRDNQRQEATPENAEQSGPIARTKASDRPRILFYASSLTPFARDWVELVSGYADVRVLCSTTGRVFRESDLTCWNEPAESGKGVAALCLRFAKRFRRMILGRFETQWFELLLDVYRLGTIRRYARSLSQQIDEFKPDIVHAMRIPYEGIIASACYSNAPLVLSIWGNDLTYHAAGFGRKRKAIQQAVRNAAGVQSDAQRDIKSLWRDYGLNESVPWLVVPASGGVDLDRLRIDLSKAEAKLQLGYEPDVVIVCNPRGLRPYVKTEVYTSLAENLVTSEPDVVFISVGTGEYLEDWSFSNDGYFDGERLITTALLPIDRLRLLLRASDILVSPSSHDGIPISVLEGMASGAFPVLSRNSALDDLIQSPDQGRFFDLGSPNQLQEQLIDVLRGVDLSNAATLNEDFIFQKYSTEVCMARILDFYEEVLKSDRAVR